MVQILEANPNVGWGSIGAAFGGGLGQGLQDIDQMSLMNKMSALKEQRQMQQALALREHEAGMLEKNGYGQLAQLHRAGVPIKDVISQYPGLLMTDKEIEAQQRDLDNISPKREMFDSYNNMIPMQDREAIEEPKEMTYSQRSQLQGMETPLTSKTAPEETERGPGGLKKSFLEQAQNDLNVGKHPFNSLPKDIQNRVMNRAKQISDEFYKEKNLESARETLDVKREAQQYQQHKPFIDKMNNLRSSAQESKKVLSQLQSLVDTHNLADPRVAKLMDKIGLTGLLSPESQMFNASLKKFFAGLKDIWGSKITNIDTQLFEKMLPSLLQTDEGRAAVIKMLSISADADLIRSDAYTQIMRENKGKIPFDIEAQVDERSSDLLEKNYKEFSELPFKLFAERSGLKAQKEKTKITPEIAKKIYEKSGRDPSLATKIAESLNYEGLE